jgi:DNA topoisomerase-1
MPAFDPSVPDPAAAAVRAGLRYVTDDRPGITRRKSRSGFHYVRPDGSRITDEATLRRIRKLAIPPAYTNVWICPLANGHIQATGRDLRGRKQYRYHSRWRETRDEAKYQRTLAFAEALPALRRKVDVDLQRPGLPREKLLATVVRLLETTLIRVGNEEYARTNGSFGLTTMLNKHVDVEGSTVHFEFRGKSGKTHRIGLQDRRLARIVAACQALPGQELFQYVDPDGQRHSIGSEEVNAYLREQTGDDFTAKDFRTWAGTVLAALALQEFQQFDSAAAAKRNVTQAIEKVASMLGNTRTICRKCYIHPELFTAYMDGSLAEQLRIEADTEIRQGLDGLNTEETAVLVFLRKRLQQEATSKTGRRRPAQKSQAKKRATQRTSTTAAAA